MMISLLHTRFQTDSGRTLLRSSNFKSSPDSFVDASVQSSINDSPLVPPRSLQFDLSRMLRTPFATEPARDWTALGNMARPGAGLMSKGSGREGATSGGVCLGAWTPCPRHTGLNCACDLWVSGTRPGPSNYPGSLTPRETRTAGFGAVSTSIIDDGQRSGRLRGRVATKDVLASGIFSGVSPNPSRIQ